MTKLLVEERTVVVPGEELSEGMDYLPGEGAYRLNDKILANKYGLFSLDGRLCKVIPLRATYIPKEGDMIIGQVSDISNMFWKVDFDWPFMAILPLREGSREYIENGEDLSKFYDIDDFVLAKVIKVTGSRSVEISMKAPGTRKLNNGLIIDCNPAKVPRIIGKQGSMISLIKEHTGCNVFVGQNGKVWIKSDKDDNKEFLVVKIIREIEAKSHLSGLTEEITKLLEEKENGLQ